MEKGDFMHTKTALLPILLVLSQVALAQPGHEAPHVHHESSAMPKEFETLKQLVGSWEGTSKMGETVETVNAVYELSSAGTVVLERLMTGTPHEMLSVYHQEGNSVAMTHYCAMGNHPHMELTKSEEKVLTFEVTKPIGIASAQEHHMHGVTLKVGPDTLIEEWVSFDEGKKKGTITFSLKRKK